METTSLPVKHHSDSTTAGLSESTGGAGSSSSIFSPTSKRRHLSSKHFHSHPHSHPHPAWKLSTGETLFRILCPGDRTGGVIGKGGSIIRQFQEETGARIWIDEAVPGSDDRVILVIGDMAVGVEEDADGLSPAQRALVRVFERILKVDEERMGEDKEVQGQVVCRLLALGSQVGCVLGKGGKIVEKIRQESGAHIRVLSREQVPACAGSGDELIHISGSFVAVKKALLSVSSCLQDNLRADAANFATVKSFGSTTHGSVPMRGMVACAQDYHSSQQRAFEDEVIFRILCPNEKVGSIIGKGGTIVRALQSETGATIKVIDAVPDCEERVIVISTCENPELRHSPTQDAVLRVHSRLTEAGSEKGPASARLLVPSQQIGCLLGRGGSIIAEMRRSTGANIRIFLKEHAPKCAQPNDEVVQVTGSFQSVQDALFHITGRIRETIFQPKPHLSVTTAPCLSTSSDIHPALLRARNEPDSPGIERYGLTTSEWPPLSYGSEVSGHRPTCEHLSPRPWASRGGSSCNVRSVSESGISMGFKGGSSAAAGSGSHLALTNATIEVVVPQQFLGFVYGENCSNLSDIKEISGAKVTIHNPKPGAAEGLVIISGSSDQMRTAQSLLHAFILCGITAT